MGLWDSTVQVPLSADEVRRAHDVGLMRAESKGGAFEAYHILGVLGETVAAKLFKLTVDENVYRRGDKADLRLPCGCKVNVKATRPGNNLMIKKGSKSCADPHFLLVWVGDDLVGPFGVVGYSSLADLRVGSEWLSRSWRDLPGPGRMLSHAATHLNEQQQQRDAAPRGMLIKSRMQPYEGPDFLMEGWIYRHEQPVTVRFSDVVSAVVARLLALESRQN